MSSLYRTQADFDIWIKMVSFGINIWEKKRKYTFDCLRKLFGIYFDNKFHVYFYKMSYALVGIDLLNIPGAQNNGTEGRLRSLLRRPPPETLRQSVGQYKNVSFNMNFDDFALFLKDHRCLNFTPTYKEVRKYY